MPSTTTPHHSPTYYEILNLSQSAVSSHDDPSALIKRAYRRALLRHHPDKTRTRTTATKHTAAATFTVDQISAAYATLSLPARRAAYDASLAAAAATAAAQTQRQQTDFQTGIETVDLDDLDCEEDGAGTGATRWYRPCRCGNPRGYDFGEADLEEAAEVGELMVGCADCSLWLRVHFAVVEDEDEDESAPRTGTGTGVGVQVER